MNIVNESDRKVTWFCFNFGDTDQDISLQHGDLRARSKATFRPVALDAKAKFYVLFTAPEAAAGVPGYSPKKRDHFGGGNVSLDGTITLKGTAGSYSVEAESGAWHASSSGRQVR
jgi:hypothetical protein